MKLSTRTRYGTRALLELALHKPGESVALKDIARVQQISLPYLEHIIAPLIAAGMIHSTKGPKGGIALAKKPADIKLAEIIQILEGSLAPVDCVENPDCCKRSGACATRDVWSELKDVMDGFLGATTLQDLADRQKSKGLKETSMYYI
jgi:Rrf2 family transcriptional regulator, cysteine metabolism repressor